MNDSIQDLPITLPFEPLSSCPFCVSQIPAQAKKCRHCGETLDHTMRALEDLKNQQQLQQAQQPMVYMNAGGGSSSTAAGSGPSSQILGTKSRVVAALLAFFFGAFGVHKFYLGQTGWGILYLLLCWTLIPMFVAFVEGIWYLLSTRRAFALKYG